VLEEMALGRFSPSISILSASHFTGCFTPILIIIIIIVVVVVIIIIIIFGDWYN
jgi:hypothetical protein